MRGRGYKGAEDQARADDIAARFKAGETMQSIAVSYRISRERVRQILKKYAGLTGGDGGARVRAVRNKAIRAAGRDERCMKRYGCTFAQLKMAKLVGAKGTWYTSPMGAFITQRNSAHNRGIQWKLKFWDWWQIWDKSGKWEQRGIGQGTYCMARYGDTGAYEVGNVFICETVINNSERPQKKSGLPRGVHHLGPRYKSKPYIAVKMLGGKQHWIGTFPDPQSAHAAYLAFNG